MYHHKVSTQEELDVALNDPEVTVISISREKDNRDWLNVDKKLPNPPKIFAFAYSKVRVHHRYQVLAMGHSQITAFDYAIVKAFDESFVEAHDNALAIMHDRSLLLAQGRVKMMAFDRSEVSWAD